MIRIDISRAIPPRLATYLLGIIPGVFFEASVAIGNPRFAVSVLSRVRDIYLFGPYALLVLLLASSLFVGQGFFLAAWIVDLIIASAFALWRFAIPRRENSFAARPVLKCLYIAVQRLLRVRYGIDRRFGGHWDDGEWRVWYSALGKPLKEFNEASMSSRTFLGCGLAGFTALYASPPLRAWYFVALCLIFTFAGCFSSVDLARWKFDPVRWSMARLRSVLLELSEASTLTEKPNTGKGSSASIDTNEGD
jgi:hypothetical protein